MNCKACAELIEEKLNSQPGIFTTKVNFQSQKAVVVFDEQETNLSKIENIIRTMGDKQYTVELLEEGIPAELPNESHYQTTPTTRDDAEGLPVFKHQFFMGFLMSFSVLSFIANIILAVAVIKK